MLLLFLFVSIYSVSIIKERTRKGIEEMKCEVIFFLLISKTSLNSSLSEILNYIKVEEYKKEEGRENEGIRDLSKRRIVN